MPASERVKLTVNGVLGGQGRSSEELADTPILWGWALLLGSLWLAVLFSVVAVLESAGCLAR